MFKANSDGLQPYSDGLQTIAQIWFELNPPLVVSIGKGGALETIPDSFHIREQNTGILSLTCLFLGIWVDRPKNKANTSQAEMLPPSSGDRGKKNTFLSFHNDLTPRHNLVDPQCRNNLQRENTNARKAQKQETKGVAEQKAKLVARRGHHPLRRPDEMCWWPAQNLTSIECHGVPGLPEASRSRHPV